MNKKTLVTLAVATGLATTITIAGPITVNGITISDARIEQITKQVEAQQHQPVTAAIKKEIIDQVVNSELLRQQAVLKGLDKSADYQAQLQNMQAMLLAQRFVENFQKMHPITDAQLKTEYDKLKAESANKKSYHAYHILVATEAEANAILAALKKGKSFAKLAEEKSTDRGSKQQGGDLGWFDPSSMVPEFSQAVTQLSKGQITQKPVKTQYGWHIIRLDDIRTEQLPPMDALKTQLTQRLMGQRIHQLIEELRAKAKITQ